MTTSPGKLLATRLVAVLHRHLAGRVDPAQIATELRSIANWLERGQPIVVKSTATDDEQSNAALEVFQYWMNETDRNQSHVQFTAKRRSRVLARLKEGRTVNDIKLAIDGCRASKFHSGDNESGAKYDDLELICRSGEKLESFIDQAPDHSSRDDERSQITKRMKRALKENDQDAYTRATDDLQRLG